MKKLAVLSIALLVLTTLAFAEVKVEPKVAFSGSGTLTWGMDLDSTPINTGFKNESSGNLTVTLVSKVTETKGGAEGDTVYGYIALKDMQLVFNSDGLYQVGDDDDAKLTQIDTDGDAVLDLYVTTWDNTNDKTKLLTDIITAPSIEAYVVLGPAKWFIYGAPDSAVSFAGGIEDDDDDKYWAEGDSGENAIKSDGTADFAGNGTGIEVAAGPATITGIILSSSDWTAASTYGAAAKASLALGPATVKVGAVFPFAAGSTMGFGGSVAVTAGPAAINAGADVALTGGAATYEYGGGVTLTLPDLMTVNADAAYGDLWGLDIEAGVDLKAVPDLTLVAKVGLWDVTTALAWGVRGNVAYKIAMGETNYVKPGVVAAVSTENGAELRVVLVGSVEAVLIPNTTFTLKFTDKNLTDAAYGSGSGLDRTLTFATKVAY
jgi:hypothetical protein